MVSSWKSVPFLSGKKFVDVDNSFSPFIIFLRWQNFDLVLPGTPALQNGSVNRDVAPRNGHVLSHMASYLCVHMLAMLPVSGRKK